MPRGFERLAVMQFSTNDTSFVRRYYDISACFGDAVFRAINRVTSFVQWTLLYFGDLVFGYLLLHFTFDFFVSVKTALMIT